MKKFLILILTIISALIIAACSSVPEYPVLNLEPVQQNGHTSKIIEDTYLNMYQDEQVAVSVYCKTITKIEMHTYLYFTVFIGNNSKQILRVIPQQSYVYTGNIKKQVMNYQDFLQKEYGYDPSDVEELKNIKAANWKTYEKLLLKPNDIESHTSETGLLVIPYYSAKEYTLCLNIDGKTYDFIFSAGK